MKKLNMHVLALGAVALIVFVVLAFLLPFVHNTVFWIAFGAAIVMALTIIAIIALNIWFPLAVK